MKRALCLLRPQLVYRRESFCTGLKAAGYKLVDALRDPGPDDVLVIWNRYFHFDEEAKRFEAAGATVVVVENGYLRESGKWFAMAKGHHSGAGKWNVGGPERWDALRIELRPWREAAGELLILGQRGIGEPGIAAPKGWAESARRIMGGRVRPHPGTGSAVPLEDDLRKAWAVATWHSAAAFQALIFGIPVYCAFPKWIGAQAATPIEFFGKRPPKRSDADRLEMFRRLAWAQWTLDEIRSGEAFAWLLR